MKRFLFAALLLALPVRAQQQPSYSNPQGGPISAAGANCATINVCVWQKIPITATTTTVTITGTFTATLIIETSADGGVTFTQQSSQTAPAVVTFAVSSLTDVRVRGNAYTSGIANANIQTAGAQFNVTTSGGGVSWYTVATLPASPALNTTAGVTDGNGYSCSSGGGSTNVLCRWNGASWVVINAGSGAAPAFSAVTAGTNAAALLMGTGGSLGVTGTGTISATAINGTALSGLATGILKNTTATGVPSIAVAGDFPTLNQNTTGTAANVTGIVAPANGGSGIASPTAHGVAIAEGASNFNFVCTSSLTGQLIQTNNAADPTCISPGVGDGNGGAVVTTTPYTVLCDSATTLRDRLTTIRFQSGASVINAPDHTASGCGANFSFAILDDGAGTITINRGGTDTFSTFNGATNTDGATSFTLTNGQYATLNNGAGGVWEVRIVSGGGGITSVDGSAGNGVQTVQGAAIAAITTSGTVQASLTEDTQTGVTSYTHITGDRGKLLIRSNSGTAMTDTLPQATAGAASTFGPGWVEEVLNTDTTAYDTITATTSTFSGTGTSTLVVPPGGWCKISSDGTNYKNECAGAFPAITSTTAVTVTNPTINTDTKMIELSLPKGYLNTLGQGFLIRAGGLYSNTAATSPALTFNVKLCTVSGCGSGTVVGLGQIVSGATSATATTNDTWTYAIFAITNATGATGNLLAKSDPGLTINLSNVGSAADTVYTDVNTATSGNIDLTAALFLDFTVAQSVAGASNSYKQLSAMIAPQSNPAQGAGGGGGTSVGMIVATCAGAVGSGVTGNRTFIGLGGSPSNGTCNGDAPIQIPVTRAMTLTKVFVKSQAAGVNASDGVIKILKNGSASTITCTIGTATTCSDTAHTVSMVAGDLVNASIDTQTSSGLTNLSVTLEYTVP